MDLVVSLAIGLVIVALIISLLKEQSEGLKGIPGIHFVTIIG